MAVKINFHRHPSSPLRTLSAQGTTLQTKARLTSRSRPSLTMRLKRLIWSLSNRKSTMSKLVGSTCQGKVSSAALKNDKSSQLRLVMTIQMDREDSHSLDLIIIIRQHCYHIRRLTPLKINYKLTLCQVLAMFRLLSANKCHKPHFISSSSTLLKKEIMLKPRLTTLEQRITIWQVIIITCMELTSTLEWRAHRRICPFRIRESCKM